MKISVVSHQTKNPIFNIGDYVQTIAAAQFVDTDSVNIIEREALNSYDGEETKVIMNGWYMFTKNWPPVEKILPLFVSFHINSTAKDVLLSPESINYFKQHEPIGCRDEKSSELLKEHGVDAYFSGCLTLTLGRSYRNDGSGTGIYIVDPIIKPQKNIHSLFSYALTLVKDLTKVISIYKKADNHELMSFLKCVVFYNQYSKVLSDDILLGAEYPSVYVKNTFSSEESKFDYAKKCLSKYSSAKLVITSRIHCYMPCIAMGTPALFLMDNNGIESSSCRFGGLQELYNTIHYTNGDFYSDDINIDNKITSKTVVTNKGLHQKLADRLAQTCIDFLSSK